MISEVMLLALISIAAQNPPLVRLPEQIRISASGVSAWVAESVAVDDSGRLSASALDRHDVERLTAVANRDMNSGTRTDSADREKPCEKSTGRVLHQFGTTNSIGELTQYAHAIFAGEVSASQQGFLFGEPGTLFAVEVSASAKGEVKRGDTVYLFYPFARISTVHGVICAQPLGTTTVPHPGDGLVLFPFLPAVGDTPIYRLDPRRQLIVTRDGRTHVPENLTRELSPEATPTLIIEQVRSAILRRENGAEARQ